MKKAKTKKMQVWWIPQVPSNSPFIAPVKSLEEAAFILDALAAYDDYQYKHHIKPDYSNAGGLVVWDEDADGEGNAGWSDWHDEKTGDDFDEWREEMAVKDRYSEIQDATKRGMK